MTCIIALEYDGKVYMGGDSASVAGYQIQKTYQPKVFTKGDFIIGFTSSFRMGQLLRYKLEIPNQGKSESDIEYLTTSFIDAVRTCLKDGGFTTILNNEEKGGFFLVGYKGKVYKVQRDFQISRYQSGYTATGAGEEFAMGAMSVLISFEIAHSPRPAISSNWIICKRN